MSKNLHNLSSLQAADLIVAGARAGADVQGGGGDLTVLRLRGGGRFGGSGGGSHGGDRGDGVLGVVHHQVFAGHIAGEFVEGDLVPAVFGGGEHLYLGAVLQLGQHFAAGAGLRADTQRGIAGIDRAGDRQRGDNACADKQKAGGKPGGGEMSELHWLVPSLF